MLVDESESCHLSQARRTRPEVGAASDGRGNLPGEGAGGGHPFRPAWRYGGFPHRGLGRSPRRKCFFALKTPESYAKKRRPRGLSNILFIRVQVTTVALRDLIH